MKSNNLEKRLKKIESRYENTSEVVFQNRMTKFFIKHGTMSVEEFVGLLNNKLGGLSPNQRKRFIENEARKELLEIIKFGEEIEEQKNKLRDI